MKPWLNKHKNVLILLLIIFVMVLLVFITYFDVRSIIRDVLTGHGNPDELADYIRAYGTRGLPIIVSLEILLAMLTVISAYPVHIVSGLCYGVFLGSLLSLVGLTMGNFLLFILFRQFNRLRTPLEKTKNARLLLSGRIVGAKHPEYIAFLFYLVPIVPNIFVPYLLAKTDVSTGRYMASITLASLPSILLCNLVGHNLSAGNYATAIIIAVIVIALLVLAWTKRTTILHYLQNNK